MIKLITFLLLFFVSTFSYSVEIKSISGVRYFPPTPYSNTAMNAYRAGALRGGVTVAGNFAVAKIRGDSALALAKQLARSNPYTLAAMGALLYYQDDIGNWFEPSQETGENTDYVSAELQQTWSAHCYASSEEITIGDIGDLPIDQSIRDECGPQIAEKVRSAMPDSQCTNFECVAVYDSGSISVKRFHNGTIYDNKSYPVTVGQQLENETYVCPPVDNPLYTIPSDSNGDGETDRCLNPATNQLYTPTPVTLDEIAPQYADDLMRHQHEAIDYLQTWEPYLDDSGNVEPQYIDSYNQPIVSPEMNEYMKNVASGNYQSSDASAPNYVPSEFVQPTQTAVNSTYSFQPFVDPTTGTVTEPNTKTDGGATPEPSPTGTATNPINVTGNITVNVEIPEDDTISQTEYEQSNRKFQQEETDLANTKTQELNTSIEQLKTQESDFIDNLGNYIQSFDVPALPTLASFFPSFNSGCVGFSLDVSVAGTVKNLNFDKHCPPWNSYVNPILTWFLYMMTSLYVLNLAGRTLTGLKT